MAARVSSRSESIQDLANAGLIFIRSNDPISWLYTSITKQKYSAAGFYYTTKVSGSQQVQVIIFDLLTNSIPLWHRQKNSTITDLLNNPAVMSIAVKKLKHTDDEMTELFRQSIVKTITGQDNQPIADSMTNFLKLQLLSQPIDTTHYTIFSLINDVIVLFDQDYSRSQLAQRLEESVLSQSNYHDKLILTQYKPSKQQLQLLYQKYVISSTHIAAINTIYIDYRTEDQHIKLRRSQFDNYLPSLSVIITEVIKILFKYPEAIDQLNANSYLMTDHDSKALILETVTNSSKIVELIASWIDNGTINYELLLKLSLDVDIKNRQLLKSLNMKPTRPIRMPLVNKPKILTLKKRNHTRSRRTFTNTISDLSNQIISISSAVNDDNQLIKIDINQLIKHVNSLYECLGSDRKLPLCPGELSRPANILVTSNQIYDISLLMTTGKRVSITSRNFDLSPFTNRELREILAALDGQIDETNFNHFHELRTALALRLAS